MKQSDRDIADPPSLMVVTDDMDSPLDKGEATTLMLL